MDSWNFLSFEPGLVGGHCIGVDPYYLTHKALEVGHNPDLILAGRRVNDSMGSYIAHRMLNQIHSDTPSRTKIEILIMGYTFKENCPDARNSLVSKMVNELIRNDVNVSVYDPWVLAESSYLEHGDIFTEEIEGKTFDGIIVAVGHSCFQEFGATKINQMCTNPSCVFDVKGIFDAQFGYQRL